MISNIFVSSKENNRLKAKYMKTKNLLKLMAVASCWYAEAVLAPGICRDSGYGSNESE
jgi:hypothetical protein